MNSEQRNDYKAKDGVNYNSEAYSDRNEIDMSLQSALEGKHGQSPTFYQRYNRRGRVGDLSIQKLPIYWVQNFDPFYFSRTKISNHAAYFDISVPEKHFYPPLLRIQILSGSTVSP